MYGTSVSDKKDGWFNGARKGDFVVLLNPFSFLNPFLDRGFYYCKSNDEDNTPLANPICYKVKYSSYIDQKSSYDRDKDYEKKSEIRLKDKNN
ncbi:MAG: hypothetical protein EBT63_02265 [Proteobacteria bacterium]|nr:hypothetical protein [Pseudomonadota bacterium]